MNKLVRILNDPLACSTAGFTYGFVTEVEFNKNFNNEALSQLFSASISGFLCSIGAEIVGSLMPMGIRAIVPLILTGVSLHIKSTYIDTDEK